MRFLAASFLFLAFASSAQADTVVVSNEGLSKTEQKAVVQDIQGTVVDRFGDFVTVEVKDAETATAKIQDKVELVEADQKVRSFTNDQFWDHQWSLFNVGGFRITSGQEPNPPRATAGADIKVVPAWSTTKGSGVTVAVVDSGVKLTHPDLLGQTVGGGRDWIENDSDPTSTYDSHGTHVSGIIAASGDNTVGISGIAPQAKLLELRTLDNNGEGEISDVASAFYYANTKGARIVNASLGTEGESELINQAVQDNPNVLFVFAAGNGDKNGNGIDTNLTPFTPCNAPGPNVICVGATNYNDNPTAWSNYGTRDVDLFAPGDKIYSSVVSAEFNKDYNFMSGTSMAAPEVSAVAALVMSAYPTLTAEQVRQAILESVDPLAQLTSLSASGGRLNAQKALVQASKIADPSNALPDPVPTPVVPEIPEIPETPKMPVIIPSNDPPAQTIKEPESVPQPTLDVGYKVKGCKRSTCSKTISITYKTNNISKLNLVLEKKVCKKKCSWKSKTYKLSLKDSKKTIKKLKGSYRFYLVATSSKGQTSISKTTKF